MKTVDGRRSASSDDQPQTPPGGMVMHVPLDRLAPCPWLPRTAVNTGELEEFKHATVTQGRLQPIVASPYGPALRPSEPVVGAAVLLASEHDTGSRVGARRCCDLGWWPPVTPMSAKLSAGLSRRLSADADVAADIHADSEQRRLALEAAPLRMCLH